ncbi:phage integrase SAM-like domain-containing protein [Clostridium sp. HBUAS56017]|uniref:tyrosine-type recombinase/integrase n=1 Tax=Clostridium sp. HBUAS56017 TaxID=2571128 RepID=UPI00117801F8
MVNKQGMLFKDLCEMCFKRCEANGVSHHTTNGYKNILKYFYEYLQYEGVSEELYCQDFTAYTYEDFKVHIKQVRKVKDITVNSYIRKLTPMLSYGMELGYIERFPYSYVKHQEVFKDIYIEEELKLLLEKPSEKDTTNRFAEFRNWAIINFLLGTGIRALELRELKISNVDLKEGLINLSHTKNKKTDKYQLVMCYTRF